METAYKTAVGDFVTTCEVNNPHNHAHGAYSKLLKAARLAWRVGLSRNELLRDVSGAVHSGRLTSRVLARWVETACNTIEGNERPII